MTEAVTEIQENKGNTVSKIFFVIILLFSLHFWELKYIPQKVNLENMFTWAVCGLAMFFVIGKKNLRFKWAILIFVIGIVLNWIASYINMRQNFKYSIFSFAYYYFILIYFLLHFLKLERKFVENVVIVFGLIYSLIFIIQYKVFPVEIFSRWVKTAMNEMQFEIIGHGFLVLSFLLVLNRYIINRKMVYLFLALGLFIVLFKCGFRTLIGGAGVIAVIMGLRLFKLSIRDLVLVIFAMIMFAAITQYGGVAYIISNMINKTETESQLGKRYIRVIETEYFYKKYPRNLSYYFIGGGKPAGKESIENYNPYAMDPGGMYNYNILWVDIGLLGFFIVVGGIATFGMVLYSLRAVFTRLPRSMIYLSSYFLYLLLVSVTNEEIYRDGIFTVQAIALYLVDIGADERAVSGSEELPEKSEQ